jgi:hypothetical protein
LRHLRRHSILRPQTLQYLVRASSSPVELGAGSRPLLRMIVSLKRHDYRPSGAIVQGRGATAPSTLPAMAAPLKKAPSIREL